MQSIQSIQRRRGARADQRRAFSSSPRAFTIIELSIVLLIMGIFAAISAPAFLDSLLFHRVETAARRLKADIDYARQRARLTSTTQTVSFSGSSYTLSGAKSLDNPNNLYVVNMQASPYSLNSATADFNGSQTLSFDGYGTPSSGGSIVLSAKSHQCTVSIDAVLGATTITSNHTRGSSSFVSGG